GGLFPTTWQANFSVKGPNNVVLLPAPLLVFRSVTHLLRQRRPSAPAASPPGAPPRPGATGRPLPPERRQSRSHLRRRRQGHHAFFTRPHTDAECPRKRGGAGRRQDRRGRHLCPLLL